MRPGEVGIPNVKCQDLTPLLQVGVALHRHAGTVEHVGVDHGGADVAVTEKFLNRPDIVTGFQQMRRERVPERVAGNPFGQACFAGSFLDRFLEGGLMNVVTPDLARAGIGRKTSGCFNTSAKKNTRALSA